MKLSLSCPTNERDRHSASTLFSSQSDCNTQDSITTTSSLSESFLGNLAEMREDHEDTTGEQEPPQRVDTNICDQMGNSSDVFSEEDESDNTLTEVPESEDDEETRRSVANDLHPPDKVNFVE